MAVNLYGAQYPELFGTLGASLFTLFTIMTLEGWVEGVVNPIMETHPYAWLFFIPFIIITTFWVFNLFTGIIVNAMQEEHTKSEAEERKHERELIHGETTPLLHEMQQIKVEHAALRKEMGGKLNPARAPRGRKRTAKAASG